MSNKNTNFGGKDIYSIDEFNNEKYFENERNNIGDNILQGYLN